MNERPTLEDRIRGGDVAALGEYLQEQRRAVLAYVERRLGAALRRKVEPEDLVQEAQAEAVRSLARTDLAGRDPFGWICQLAEQRIVDAHRRYFGAQKRDAAREVPLQGGGGDSSDVGLIPLLAVTMTTPSQAFSRNAREERMHAALAALPDDQREALRMRYVENLPSKEIARRLGRTDAAARVLLTRALKRLQEVLGETT